MSKRNVAPRVDGDPEDMTPVYSKEPESCEGCFLTTISNLCAQLHLRAMEKVGQMEDL